LFPFYFTPFARALQVILQKPPQKQKDLLLFF